jgi:hypothetical protein
LRKVPLLKGPNTHALDICTLLAYGLQLTLKRPIFNGEIVVPRPSASALLKVRRQKACVQTFEKNCPYIQVDKSRVDISYYSRTFCSESTPRHQPLLDSV